MTCAIASVAIGLIILPRAWSLLRDVVDGLLEATPRGVGLVQVREHIRGVHDLHAWTSTGEVPVLSAHVVVEDPHVDWGSGPVLDALDESLGDHFDLRQVTLQLEPVGHADHETEDHA